VPEAEYRVDGAGSVQQKKIRLCAGWNALRITCRGIAAGAAITREMSVGNAAIKSRFKPTKTNAEIGE
jgi:hypothetical protein